MSCIISQDPQLHRLAEAIAAKVGQQRFSVWFNNSTRIDLKPDALEICVPNDFISEWIGSHFSKPIQEATEEVLGVQLSVRYAVVPQLFDPGHAAVADDGAPRPDVPVVIEKPARRPMVLGTPTSSEPSRQANHACYSSRSRLRQDLSEFVVGPSNQLAYNAATHVAQFPGTQYTPLFIHGGCGLGKTHLLQGLCRRFIELHPTKRWAYMTGEEFTNEFILAMRANRLGRFSSPDA